jgi:ABC-type branched-subunit amino acid transport system ATPase component
MMERPFSDNIRGLVNTTTSPSRTALLLGENGAGKSSGFGTLRGLRRFVTGEDWVPAAFRSTDLTKWQTQPMQR